MGSVPSKLIALLVGVVACGTVTKDPQWDDGKSDTDDDPPPAVDAGPDAAPSPVLAGLGKACEVAKNGTDCPTSAPDCIELGTGSYCSPRCVTGGTGVGTTNGGFNNSVPEPDNAVCGNAFKETVGQPWCGLVTNWFPHDDPIVADKPYTDLAWHCVVGCEANACPTTMVAHQIRGGCYCLPR